MVVLLASLTRVLLGESAPPAGYLDKAAPVSLTLLDIGRVGRKLEARRVVIGVLQQDGDGGEGVMLGRLGLDDQLMARVRLKVQECRLQYCDLPWRGERR